MTIKFNKKFYKLAAINKGVLAYKQLAEFSVNEKSDAFEVRIEKIKNNFKNELIADEFCNYVLAEIKNAS